MRRLSLFACTLVFGSLLTGCESLQRTDSLIGSITPYRIDIVQGNAVTKEQLALLKPGMTRLQVRDILGTPLLTDPFHAHRWDYVFSLRRPNTDVQRRGVVVFEDSSDVVLDAGDIAAGEGYVYVSGLSQSNPLTGNPVDQVWVANGDSDGTNAFLLGVLYQSDT